MLEFQEFQKIPRLRRDIVVTEKIDGTNSLIKIVHKALLYGLATHDEVEAHAVAVSKDFYMLAGSRSRWITPNTAENKQADNYGFAGWCQENAEELFKLGEGSHYGEWWGSGIQRRYKETTKRFSLFNVKRWTAPDALLPSCVSLVPLLYEGPWSDEAIKQCLAALRNDGSRASPGFMQPEGIVVYHTASRHLYKVTLENDEKAKDQQ